MQWGIGIRKSLNKCLYAPHDLSVLVNHIMETVLDILPELNRVVSVCSWSAMQFETVCMNMHGYFVKVYWVHS